MQKKGKISWTKRRLNALREQYGTAASTRELADQIGVSYNALKSKAQVLRLKRDRFSGSPWTKYLEVELTRLYPTTLNSEISKILGVTEGQISSKAFKLGLHKTKEFMLYQASFTVFKVGQSPINKGKRQIDYMSADAIERTKATRFKKGEIPPNKKHFRDGDITVRHRKDRPNQKPHKYIRVSLGIWKELQIYNWEKLNGPIPKGFVLACQNGDTLDCDPSNWKLLSKSDNAIRNSGSLRLSDGYVAFTIVGKNNMHLYDEVLKDKKLIEAKRQEILLKRTINETKRNSAEA